MLGRTANDLYWLSRYVERTENMARLIEAGYRIALLPRAAGDDGGQEWASTLESAGSASQYYERHGTLSTRKVVDFLLFDATNPSSIAACLAAARRNARAQRTALTREMWESLNSSWLEFKTITPATLRPDALPRILDWIKERSAAYRGALLNTILRNDTFCFSQLGTFLERADNTARILDVKYYVLLPAASYVGSSLDNVQWESILRSVSAYRSYGWVYDAEYNPVNIADFLILNGRMPRSLAYCYEKIVSNLGYLEKEYGDRHAAHDTAAAIRLMLDKHEIRQIVESGLHEFLEDFISQNNRLGQEIADAYQFYQT